MRIPRFKSFQTRVFQDRRRRFPRHRADLPLTITILSDEGYTTIHGRMNDIAEGGLGVLMASELPAGEVVQVEFMLPPDAEPFRARAVVRYRKGYFHGIEFLGLSDEQKQQILEYCIDREPATTSK